MRFFHSILGSAQKCGKRYSGEAVKATDWHKTMYHKWESSTICRIW